MKTTDRFYSSIEWIKLRSKVRAAWKRAGLPCAYCGQPFGSADKYVVDHIKNRRLHPNLSLDPSNLQCLHHQCNTRKASWSENTSKKQIGIDGFPHGWGDNNDGSGVPGVPGGSGLARKFAPHRLTESSVNVCPDSAAKSLPVQSNDQE